MLSCIVAMDCNNIIGLPDGTIPWDCATDRKFLKDFVKNQYKICGRKTWESIKDYKWAVDINVISRDRWLAKGTDGPGFYHYPTIDVEEYLLRCGQGDLDYVVIGGAEIYALASPYVSSLYVTRIEKSTCNAANAVKFPWGEYAKFHWKEELYKELEDNVSVYKLTKSA